MRISPLPDNEDIRLAALKRYKVLDSADEIEFDNITSLASTISNKPISLVSLIDCDRQWFKSAHGLDAKQTSRDVAFCSHAVTKNDELEVKDATLDERFHDNPLVTGPPFLRYYFGIPIRSYDGFPLGTLCCIDTKAGDLSDVQKRDLRKLAKLVESQFDLKLKNLNLTDTQELLDLIINSQEDALIVKDSQQKVSLFNNAYRLLVPSKNRSKLKLNTDFSELFDDQQVNLISVLDQLALEQGEYRNHLRLKDEQGKEHLYLVNKKRFNTTRDEVCVATTVADRTEYESLVKSNQLLSKDLTQLANAISSDMGQSLASLKNLSEWIKEESGSKISPENFTHLCLLQSRIHKLTDLSHSLANYCHISEHGTEMSTINVKSVCQTILEEITDNNSFKLVVQDCEVYLQYKLFTLVMRCLIENAYVHHPTKKGICHIHVKNKPDSYQISVIDDGDGIGASLLDRVFKMGVAINTPEHNAGFGLFLVKRIMQEVNGEVTIQSTQGEGCTVTIDWPSK